MLSVVGRQYGSESVYVGDFVVEMWRSGQCTCCFGEWCVTACVCHLVGRFCRRQAPCKAVGELGRSGKKGNGRETDHHHNLH